MTVRVRFAPSPTGNLHIGGARTALFCYLYAKAHQGKFVIRIEDTDQARSKREYEEAMIADLKWLGLTYDEGPGDIEPFGPYRQSERLEIYARYAQQLIDNNLAYYCFCTEEELLIKKERAQKEAKAPHYDGKCRHLGLEEATNRLNAGEKAVVRFKAYQKSYVFTDLVRGRVVFPEGMVGDFVILRSDGMPVYNYCCVIDDWLMQMSHIIRAEEHLPNTLRQLMLYEALEAPIPAFAHVSLLVGKDRQKLSKRHGATSVSNYREETYLPQAMVNYLCLLGWSHPHEKEIFTLEDIIPVFDFNRMSKSPAVFDLDKFHWVNGQHLRNMELNQLVRKVEPFVARGHGFHQQTQEWKEKCLELFKDQIQFFKEILIPLDELFSPVGSLNDEIKDILSWDTTPLIVSYLHEELGKISTPFVTLETFEIWSQHIKKELKVTGKKLFMGMRATLTAKGHGPELKLLVPLTPVTVLRQRVYSLREYLK